MASAKRATKATLHNVISMQLLVRYRALKPVRCISTLCKIVFNENPENNWKVVWKFFSSNKRRKLSLRCEQTVCKRVL